MENTALQGEVPAAIFGLPQLQTVLVPFIFLQEAFMFFTDGDFYLYLFGIHFHEKDENHFIFVFVA